MGIELLIVVLVGAGLAFWYFNRDAKTTDLNSDGKTDVKDALVAVKNTIAGVKAAADVNKDGKLDAADVKVVATKVKVAAKKVEKTVEEEAPKVKAAAKKVVKTAKAEIAGKRTRKDGKFVKDDPSTPDVNEAFKDGKAPVKKPKAPKK